MKKYLIAKDIAHVRVLVASKYLQKETKCALKICICAENKNLRK